MNKIQNNIKKPVLSSVEILNIDLKININIFQNLTVKYQTVTPKNIAYHTPI